MRSRSTQTGAFVILALACFTLAAAVAPDKCKVHKLELPDPETLKLPDGEHVIASVDTENGKFEARVNVKNKVASRPRLYIGGKLLREARESEIPKDLLDCLKESERTGSNSGSLVDTAARAFGWVSPPPSPRVACIAVAECVKGPWGGYACGGQVCCTGNVIECENFYCSRC